MGRMVVGVKSEVLPKFWQKGKLIKISIVISLHHYRWENL